MFLCRSDREKKHTDKRTNNQLNKHREGEREGESTVNELFERTRTTQERNGSRETGVSREREHTLKM